MTEPKTETRKRVGVEQAKASALMLEKALLEAVGDATRDSVERGHFYDLIKEANRITQTLECLDTGNPLPMGRNQAVLGRLP